MRGNATAAPWATSLMLHAIVLAVAAYFVDDSPTTAAPELVAIDIIDAPGSVEPVAEEPSDSSPGEAGRPAAGDPALGREAKRGAPAKLEVAQSEPTPAAFEPTDEFDEPLAASVTEALGIEIGGEGLGGMSEEGLGGMFGDGFGGYGGGNGRGRGGAGTGRGADAKAKSTKSKRSKSKARPARLIYPKRFRKEVDGEVFVVILTVAKNGSVDGVRLKHGVHPHKDEKALDAVWRFRYDPARDRDGRKIKSRVVQRFMIY